jgi:hypothetical protein
MGLFDTIRPSSPDASSYIGFPADMDDWNCEQWKQYYIRNKASLGKTKAVSILNNDSLRIGMFANVHSCPYDCQWATYMAGEGLDPSNIFSTIYCTTVTAVNTGSSVVNVASNVVGTVDKITSSKIVTTLLIGGIAYLGYKVFLDKK